MKIIVKSFQILYFVVRANVSLCLASCYSFKNIELFQTQNICEQPNPIPNSKYIKILQIPYTLMKKN